MRDILMATAVAITLLQPAILGAQEAKWRSASSDEILRVLAGGRSEATGGSGSPDGIALARSYALAFLTQSSGDRVHPDHFGPRSRAELDAFADRLVAIAIADPQSHATDQIRIALLFSRNPGDPGDNRVQYPGAYDALLRIYEGGPGSYGT